MVEGVCQKEPRRPARGLWASLNLTNGFCWVHKSDIIWTSDQSKIEKYPHGLFGAYEYLKFGKKVKFIGVVVNFFRPIQK